MTPTFAWMIIRRLALISSQHGSRIDLFRSHNKKLDLFGQMDTTSAGPPSLRFRFKDATVSCWISWRSVVAFPRIFAIAILELDAASAVSLHDSLVDFSH